MLAVVNGFAGLGINDIPSRLQGLGYIKGLGQTQSAESATTEILGRVASGSRLVNGSIDRSGYLTNKHPLDPGNIQTALYSQFQGSYKSYGPAPPCVMVKSNDPNVADQVRCGWDAGTDPSGQYYFNAWMAFLQSSVARSIVLQQVNYKLNDIAAREAGTVGTASAIATSEAEWTKRLAEHMSTVQATETAAIQAIRDAQAIPLNYATPTPVQQGSVQAGTPDSGVRTITTTTTPSVIVPVPEPTVMQGSPDPSGAIWASGGGTVSMQANDVLANIPGPSTQIGGFNIPWLLLGGVGLALYMFSSKKKGR